MAQTCWGRDEVEQAERVGTCKVMNRYRSIRQPKKNHAPAFLFEMADDAVREKRQRVEEEAGASDQGEEPDVKRARVEPPADPPLGPTFVPAGTHEAAAGPAETEQEESTSHSHFDDNPDEITGRVTCRVLIPSKAVGRVIGKGGEVADAIRSETGVRLVVDKSSVGVERLVRLWYVASYTSRTRFVSSGP